MFITKSGCGFFLFTILAKRWRGDRTDRTLSQFGQIIFTSSEADVVSEGDSFAEQSQVPPPPSWYLRYDLDHRDRAARTHNDKNVVEILVWMSKTVPIQN